MTQAETERPRGVFITIEGLEGAGKTTQAGLLYRRLRPRQDVIHTREPGGTAIGERIRALVLAEEHGEMSAEAEMLLFAASRAQFVAEVVEPALRQGRCVISERFVDASLAYQGYARGLDLRLVRQVNAAATRGIIPDLTLLLDIDPAVGLERARMRGGKEGRKGKGDRLEQESLDFFQRVREGFLTIAREDRDRVRVVNANRPPEIVHEEIGRLVEELLVRRGWRGSSSC